MRADHLHVVSVVSNPIRWESRMRLYRQFCQHMLDSGVKLYTVECVLGDRHHELADMPHITHIPVRHNTLLWHKESLANIGFSRVDPSARCIALIDGDIEFRNPGWARDTVEALQQYDVVQPWEHAYDLGPGPGGDHVELHKSFCSLFHKKRPLHSKWQAGYDFGHPGFAWAMSRQALEWLGGFIDFAAMGSADHNQAMGFLGRIRETFPADISPEFTAAMLAWERRATAHVGNNIGYVPGTVHHNWHGPKRARNYVSRWDILRRHEFNPVTDVKRNLFGVVELSGNKPGLRHDIDLYFRSRLEDCNANV